MGVASQLYLARTKSLWDAVIQPIVSSASHHPTFGRCRICWSDLLLKQFRRNCYKKLITWRSSSLCKRVCICIIHGRLRCAPGQDFPLVDPCSEKFELGACLDFMEWCNFIFSEPFSALQIRPAAIWCGWEVISFRMNKMMQVCLTFSALKTKRSWSFNWS